MSGEVVRSLFVTLRRGTTRRPWPHRRIIEALGLSRPHDCVEKPNNASVRGMLMKVPHLVLVETDKMFYYRNMRDYYQGLCRPPLAVQHVVPSVVPQALAPPPTQHVQTLLQEHVMRNGLDGFAKNWQPKKPIKYLQDKADSERVRALTEKGVHSETVKRMVQREAEAKARALKAKRRPVLGSGAAADDQGTAADGQGTALPPMTSFAQRGLSQSSQ